VHEVPALVRDKHWTETSVNGLPPYIGIARLASTERELISYYHSALCFAYAAESEERSDGQAIIYTPHGIPGRALEALPASGISQVVGLLHGLHEITNPKVILAASLVIDRPISFRDLVDSWRKAESRCTQRSRCSASMQGKMVGRDAR
jgi:hypothetical protein